MANNKYAPILVPRGFEMIEKAGYGFVLRPVLQKSGISVLNAVSKVEGDIENKIPSNATPQRTSRWGAQMPGGENSWE